MTLFSNFQLKIFILKDFKYSHFDSIGMLSLTNQRRTQILQDSATNHLTL